MRIRSLFLLALAALVLTSLAVAAARAGAAPPAIPSTEAPSPGRTQRSSEPALEEPKIVRWVCTDHLCGGCDGACSRSGHVAVSRKGHCACTPKAGGKLDLAIRKAFQPHIKGR